MAKVSATDPSNAHSSMAKSNDHDVYCWVCHDQKATVFCSTCPRSYHRLCMAGNQDMKNEWRCDCCMKLDKARSNWDKWKFDSNSLKIAFERSIDTKEGKKLLKVASLKDQYGKKLMNPIDLDKIWKKIEANQYETPEELYFDVKWFQHNLSIIRPNNPKYGKFATEFVASCELELTSLSHCTDCYERSEKRAKHWFTAYCIPPHLLIWAKFDIYPLWPAKLMSADDKMVDVQFFGDHTFETVPVENCFIYSEQHPEKETFEITPEFEIAQQECQKYIQRLRARFGDFKYGKDGEKLNLKKIKCHLENMIPKLSEDGEPIEIHFKRLIPMDKSFVMDIDDSPLNSSGSHSSTQSAKSEHSSDEPMDLVELTIESMFCSDEPVIVDAASDPLTIDPQSSDDLNRPSTHDPEPSIVNSELDGEINGKPEESLKRSRSEAPHKSKRMRLDENECNHVNSSERPESSCSCESAWSEATVDFEFDKQQFTDDSAVAVEPLDSSIPKHDVVHSTQSTPPPIIPTGLSGIDSPIRAYIEALERLKNELWSQNMKYEKQLRMLHQENMQLRKENQEK